MKSTAALLLFCVLPALAFAESALTIDRLERTDVSLVKKEVGFSALLEGTVADPDLAVLVLVYQPSLKAWRAFPAATERSPESLGRYRWRAVCQFGRLDGRGAGEEYQVRVVAFEPAALDRGLPENAIPGALRTGTLVLTRVR